MSQKGQTCEKLDNPGVWDANPEYWVGETSWERVKGNEKENKPLNDYEGN